MPVYRLTKYSDYRLVADYSRVEILKLQPNVQDHYVLAYSVLLSPS